MMDKNKSLIKAEETIFNKIKSFFKRLFKYKKNRLETIHINKSPKVDLDNIADENEIENEYFISDIIGEYKEIYDYNGSSKISNRDKKERFFRLYDDVKNRKTNLQYIDSNDLIKINKILREEEKIKRDKLVELKNRKEGIDE